MVSENIRSYFLEPAMLLYLWKESVDVIKIVDLT